MKTKEELKELKNQIQALNTKLKELDEEELKEIAGGIFLPGTGCFVNGISFDNNTIDIENDIHGGIIYNSYNAGEVEGK